MQSLTPAIHARWYNHDATRYEVNGFYAALNDAVISPCSLRRLQAVRTVINFIIIYQTQACWYPKQVLKPPRDLVYYTYLSVQSPCSSNYTARVVYLKPPFVISQGINDWIAILHQSNSLHSCDESAYKQHQSKSQNSLISLLLNVIIDPGSIRWLRDTLHYDTEYACPVQLPLGHHGVFLYVSTAAKDIASSSDTVFKIIAAIAIKTGEK